MAFEGRFIKDCQHLATAFQFPTFQPSAWSQHSSLGLQFQQLHLSLNTKASWLTWRGLWPRHSAPGIGTGKRAWRLLHSTYLSLWPHHSSSELSAYIWPIIPENKKAELLLIGGPPSLIPLRDATRLGTPFWLSLPIPLL